MALEKRLEQLGKEIEGIVNQASGFLTRDNIIQGVEELHAQELSVPASEHAIMNLGRQIAQAIKDQTGKGRLIMMTYGSKEVYVPQERVVGSTYRS